jgi:hypothetical protein
MPRFRPPTCYADQIAFWNRHARPHKLAIPTKAIARIAVDLTQDFRKAIPGSPGTRLGELHFAPAVLDHGRHAGLPVFTSLLTYAWIAAIGILRLFPTVTLFSSPLWTRRYTLERETESISAAASVRKRSFSGVFETFILDTGGQTIVPIWMDCQGLSIVISCT